MCLFYSNDFGELYTYFRDAAITEDYFFVFCFWNSLGNAFKLSNPKYFPNLSIYCHPYSPCPNLDAYHLNLDYGNIFSISFMPGYYTPTINSLHSC